MEEEMNIQIKSRFTAAVLFEHDCENNSIRMTLELAIKSGANLSDADLSGADLSGADLSDAYLSDADLSGANLSDADLIRYPANSFQRVYRDSKR